MANSLCYLGSVALLEGDYNRATALLGESLALGRELGNALSCLRRLQTRASWH